MNQENRDASTPAPIHFRIDQELIATGCASVRDSSLSGCLFFLFSDDEFDILFRKPLRRARMP
jgi:hypothetical protein